MYYVNTYKQCFVNSVNMQLKQPIVTDYATDKIMQIAFLDKCGKPIKLNSAAKIMIAADIDYNLDTSPCFYSVGELISDNVVRFEINTYTVQYLDRVKYSNTTMYVQISMQLDDKTSVLLQDVILAQPRVYVDGLPPSPVNQYYTKAETDQLLNDIQEQIDNIDVEPQYIYQSTPRLFYLSNTNGDLSLATPPSSNITFSGSQIQYISGFEWVLSPLDEIKLVMTLTQDDSNSIPSGATLYLTTAEGNTIGLRTCQGTSYFQSVFSDSTKRYIVLTFSARYTDEVINIKSNDKLWILFSNNVQLHQDTYRLNAAESVESTVLTINYPFVGMNQIFRFDEKLKDIKAYVDTEIANNKGQTRDYSKTQIVEGVRRSNLCIINMTLDQNVIQYFDFDYFTSLEIVVNTSFGWLDANAIPLNYTKCFQIWIAPPSDVYTISTMGNFNVIDMPDSLAALDESGYRLMHVFTLQVSHIIDPNDNGQKWVGSLNYNYKFAIKGDNQ